MRISQVNLDREKLYSNVEDKIKAKLQSIAARSDCAVNMVTNTILADALGISLEDRYDIESKFYSKVSGKARKRTKGSRRNS